MGVSLGPAGPWGLFKARHLSQRQRETVRSLEQAASRPHPRPWGPALLSGDRVGLQGRAGAAWSWT